jgi:streptomycin 6-kinase
LDRLPNLIEACSERWHLSIEAPVPGLSYSYVALAVTVDGSEAVLKITVPNPELTTEIAALRAFRGRPVVDLLASDQELGALLLRRLVPGTPLSRLKDDEETTAIAARLMRDVPAPEPSDHPFPTVGRWTRAFDRLRARFDGGSGPLPGPLVEKAERLFAELDASASQRMLLHGDLHHDNVLADVQDGWVLIDPKGVIGDPAYEAARFQHNPIPGFLSMDHPCAVAERRIEILASILQEDRARLLAWAFFDAVLAACWDVEESSDWRYHLACAELFDGMMQGNRG